MREREERVREREREREYLIDNIQIIKMHDNKTKRNWECKGL